MTEIAFLDAVSTFLSKQSLGVAPVAIGVAEPTAAASLPAVVLSLESSERSRGGLGAGEETVKGVLPASTRLDLANPVFPADGLTLLDDTRLRLNLLHGGLVREDGSEDPLGAGDLSVRLTLPGPNPGDPDSSIDLSLVHGLPGAGEFSAQEAAGQLTFGTALPSQGSLSASYFVGRWQRRVESIEGVLRLDSLAPSADGAADLSVEVARAMTSASAGTSIDRLLHAEVVSVAAVGGKEAAFGDARRRTIRFSFEYERILDRAESAGGLIGRIPVTTKLSTLVVDPNSGAISETLSTEAG